MVDRTYRYKKSFATASLYNLHRRTCTVTKVYTINLRQGPLLSSSASILMETSSKSTQSPACLCEASCALTSWAPISPTTNVSAVAVGSAESASMVPSKMHTKTPALKLYALLIVLLMAGCCIVPVAALCECGYTSSIGTPSSTFTFTDLIESDFLHIRNISLDTDWKRQDFSVTPEAGRGPYGMNFSVTNIMSNPISDHFNWTGPGELGGDPGVQLVVKGGIPLDGYVDVAQMNSAREDLLWGSYRAALKLTLVPGTCSAFFWYFNDSQEIDMEFLSSQFDVEHSKFPVNLVLQSKKSAQQGFNSQGTGNYVIANLPFNPTTGFHEYRIDFISGKVIFYADGKVLATMNTSEVPSEPGHMILTQWSNGNYLWSSGPPTQDATMAVGYVKAYFNSSDPGRQASYGSRCKDSSTPGALCMISDQSFAPDLDSPLGNSTAAEVYFFTDQLDMAQDQIYYHKSGVTTLRSALSRSLLLMLLLMILAAILL